MEILAPGLEGVGAWVIEIMSADVAGFLLGVVIS